MRTGIFPPESARVPRKQAKGETMMRDRRMLLGTSSILALSAAALLLNATAAEARVTRLQITEKQSPTFGGYVFKDVGAYEKIVGKAYGERDSCNSACSR